MKVMSYIEPKSSFLSLEKDLAIIVDKILADVRLKKLLYYPSKDALIKPALTEDQSIELFGKQIKIVPKLYVDSEVFTYLIISFDNFLTNATNPQFRDNVLEVDVICHFDQWQLTDFKLRPYKIAAEIDSMLNNQRLTGIGLTEFLGCNQIVLNDEYAGLCLMYRVVHGEEDKKNMLTPQDEKVFLNDYFSMDTIGPDDEDEG